MNNNKKGTLMNSIGKEDSAVAGRYRLFMTMSSDKNKVNQHRRN